MDNLQLKKCRLRKPECLSAKPVDVLEELFNRTSPQNPVHRKQRKARSRQASQWDWEMYGIFDPGDGASRRKEQADCH